MAALFSPGANAIARGIVVLVPLTIVVLSVAAGVYWRSSYRTGVGLVVDQPVPFSHKHHVSGLGIDCRYCHTTAEESSSAGMPPTETCMNCHAQLYTDADMLAPVRRSWETDTPLRWNRVHEVPGFVYFDHSVHVTGGVGCVTCHGRVDMMPLVSKQHALSMQWCLDCHRRPEAELIPRDKVFDLGWVRPPDGADLAPIADASLVRTEVLTSCSACHR